MIKRTVAIGFLLFAMFFGAGNLIFPPNVGWLSGANFYPAILGFVITGVGLPLIGVIAGAFSDEGFITEVKRIGPIFAILFMVSIYLTIGPFFAIPRTATVAYEMGVLPFINTGNQSGGFTGMLYSFASVIKGHFFTQSTISIETIFYKLLLCISSVVYFIIVLWLSLNPSKIVDRVGEILTPMLLLTMLLLIVRAFFILDTPVVVVDPIYQVNPFVVGFSEGYQTMDTMAAVAFSIIVLTAVKAAGVSERKDVFKYSVMAGAIAATGLGLIYISLAWIGNHFLIDAVDFAAQNQARGVYILSRVTELAFGSSGKLLLSTIVTLACLTTAIGLVVAVSSYFHEIYPKISYKIYAIVFTLISLVLANQGLDQIIKGAVPILMIIYPITIVLIALVLIDKLLKGMPNIAMKLPIFGTVIISTLSVIFLEVKGRIETFLELQENMTLSLLEKEEIRTSIDFYQPIYNLLKRLLQNFYFHDASMEWVTPAIILLMIGLALGYIYKRKNI